MKRNATPTTNRAIVVFQLTNRQFEDIRPPFAAPRRAMNSNSFLRPERRTVKWFEDYPRRPRVIRLRSGQCRGWGSSEALGQWRVGSVEVVVHVVESDGVGRVRHFTENPLVRSANRCVPFRMVSSWR
jgi:hypothetical protein